MKKLLCLVLIIVLLTSLTSCGESGDPYLLLDEFVKEYGAEGVIFSPKIAEGQPGYVSPGLMEQVYRFSGDFPENYAIFLNSRPDYGSECGVFLCEDADMLLMMQEVCLERMKLLDGKGERSFLKIKGKMLFYSTMIDRARAQTIWKEIIR